MPGIGSFGRFMIPFGSTMGSTLNTFNSYGQQMLNNRLQQQQMQLEQQRALLDQQRFKLEDARGRFDMQKDVATRQSQIAGAKALGSAFAQAGQMQSDPNKRRGYDAMANAAMQMVPDEQIKEIGAAFGIGPEDYKAALDQARAFEATENARYMQGVNRTAGFEPGAPGGGGGGGSPAGFAPRVTPPPGSTYSPDGTKFWSPVDGRIHDMSTGAVVGGP